MVWLDRENRREKAEVGMTTGPVVEIMGPPSLKEMGVSGVGFLSQRHRALKSRREGSPDLRELWAKEMEKRQKGNAWGHRVGGEI